MEMQPNLSVLVPVYNVKHYLSRCLDSLLAQTYRALDIVLVDDGSTDGSGEICDAYAMRDARIRVVHKENRGQTSARKAGLRQADTRAPFVTFVDSDDWIEPWAFETMMRVAEEQSVDCVIAGHLEDTGTSSRELLPDFPEGRYDRVKMEQEFLPFMMGREPFFAWGIFTSLCNKVFAKSVISDVLLAEDERIVLGEDTAAVFPALFRASSIYVLQRSYYHYIQKRQSMVKKIGAPDMEREQYAALYDSVKGQIPQNVRGGWTAHMLFLMVQRADTLYAGWEKLDYLFPFPYVRRGTRIVLYGGGTYGQRLYQAIQRTGIVTVVGWADRNAAALREIGLTVNPPESIAGMEADDIVVAISLGRAREGARQDLARRFPEKRVHVWDVPLIFSEETRQAFRLD